MSVLLSTLAAGAIACAAAGGGVDGIGVAPASNNPMIVDAGDYPNGIPANLQWGLGAVKGPANADGVTVAVVDTGVDATHADLAGKVAEGIDYTCGR